MAELSVVDAMAELSGVDAMAELLEAGVDAAVLASDEPHADSSSAPAAALAISQVRVERVVETVTRTPNL
ncbi:hypothetical protein EH165_03955 [Nakamurella antarctica]|uniref:Uncharacterized protein n=2 Tax=Nakamurella antarctica TaxID=1902245 RepID=A0A3G8ZJA2_9ACTN|nr:hypothetical protein EH165_03955 [Nakamurella antarctica]